MSYTLTSRERIQRIIEHKEADRTPIVDLPWASTIARWHREGMPEGADWAEYLDVDCVRHILPDNSPRYPVRLIEATGEYRVYTTPWGATRKDFYDSSGAIGYLDYVVKDRASWAQAKERMQPSDDRIPWSALDREYGWSAEAEPGKAQEIVASLVRSNEQLARALFSPTLYPSLAEKKKEEN